MKIRSEWVRWIVKAEGWTNYSKNSLYKKSILWRVFLQVKSLTNVNIVTKHSTTPALFVRTCYLIRKTNRTPVIKKAVIKHLTTLDLSGDLMSICVVLRRVTSHVVMTFNIVSCRVELGCCFALNCVSLCCIVLNGAVFCSVVQSKYFFKLGIFRSGILHSKHGY